MLARIEYWLFRRFSLILKHIESCRDSKQNGGCNSSWAPIWTWLVTRTISNNNLSNVYIFHFIPWVINSNCRQPFKQNTLLLDMSWCGIVDINKLIFMFIRTWLWRPAKEHVSLVWQLSFCCVLLELFFNVWSCIYKLFAYFWNHQIDAKRDSTQKSFGFLSWALI